MLPRVFFACPTQKLEESDSKVWDICFWVLLVFLVSLLFLKSVRIFLEEIFWRSKQNKYGALNGLIITHVLLERCNEGFYLIISELNALKIPDQIHRRMHTQLVWLFQAKAFPATFFASALAVAKYQLACQIIKHIIQRKNSISNKEKLDHSGNYLQQNIQAKIWVVDSWANVWTFGIYLHQKSKTELWGVKSSKCSFSTHS